MLRHVLDPLMASLALFESSEDLTERIDILFSVRRVQNTDSVDSI